MDTQWKKIWEDGNYTVNCIGDVARVLNYDECFGFSKCRLLKPNIDRYGYRRIYLYYKGRRYNIRIHKLVAVSFIGDIPNGYEVNHKDGNKNNNFYKNLEIVTKLDNIKHAYRTGLIVHKGVKNSQAILDEGDVLLIRDFFLDKRFTYNILSDIFNVSYSTIYDVVNRNTWTHI